MQATSTDRLSRVKASPTFSDSYIHTSPLTGVQSAVPRSPQAACWISNLPHISGPSSEPLLLSALTKIFHNMAILKLLLPTQPRVSDPSHPWAPHTLNGLWDPCTTLSYHWLLPSLLPIQALTPGGETSSSTSRGPVLAWSRVLSRHSFGRCPWQASLLFSQHSKF